MNDEKEMIIPLNKIGTTKKIGIRPKVTNLGHFYVVEESKIGTFKTLFIFVLADVLALILILGTFFILNR